MMNYAVRRCGGKMRKFDWGHIVAELIGFELKPYSAKQLEEAKNEAIERYMMSEHRDRSRNVKQLLCDDGDVLYSL